MDDPGTRACERFGDVGPGVNMPAPACFNDGQGSGAALFAAGAETQAAGDHRDVQSSLGLVVRRGQLGISRARADSLGFVIPVEFAGALQPGLDRIEDHVPLVLGAGVEQPSQFAELPVSEAD